MVHCVTEGLCVDVTFEHYLIEVDNDTSLCLCLA